MFRVVPRLLFPHITRIFSAPAFRGAVKTGIWLVLAAFLISNFYAKANLTPEYWNQLVQAIQLPNQVSGHVDLAQILRREGLNTRAEQELAFAGYLALPGGKDGYSGVLGITTDPISLLKLWQNKPNILLKNYRYWQDVVSKRPDYRDGYLRLASLAYQLSKTSEAGSYLNKALSLDPNNAAAQKMELFLTSRGK